MGSYASEPKVDKESLDEYNDRLNCGASSMQGWRVSQEDAHNCLLNYDTNTAFFAVYDGHGGHEVALYCSQKLPDYIKNTESYKEGNIESALVEGFLEFDKTITTPEVISVLKEIAGVEDDEEVSDEEENVDSLYKEAAMPIEQVIEKYTSNLVNPVLKNLKKSDKAPKSPFLKAKKENVADENECSSSVEPEVSESSKAAGTSSDTVSSNSVSSSSTSREETTVKEESGSSNSEAKSNNIELEIPEIKITVDGESEIASGNEPKKHEIIKNGDIAMEKVTSSHIVENGDETPKGKGKAKMKRIEPSPVRISPRTKQSPNQLYKTLLLFGACEEDSEDEEDETFEGAKENSSEDDEENITNSHLEDGSDNSSAEEDEDGGEEEEEDGVGEEDDEDEMDMEFTRNMKDEPGSDSGCTAVVALLKDDKLWVANAGDSRCIVCRDGKAIEMSFDHKPEDEPERDRIVKAGGRVTMDGRVNNGLNLSRAIGDHAYKQNTELGPREQMITALPDIKILEINQEEDEFMILACDGIWNFMSSQEVVDFVRPKVKENREKLSSICEELFDRCLAPNTMGDGTGCDNMTAIIIQFKSSKKRSASPEKTGLDSNKRVKTDKETVNTV